MATIASMIYSIEAQTSSIEKSMANVATVVDKAEASMLSTIVSGVALGEALEHLGELGLRAFEQLAEAIPELIEHTIHVGNSLFEMSLKTGASVENLSALRYVASQTGIDFDSFNTTLYKMQQALGATGEKATALQVHLDILGLNLQTLKNEKPDQAFIDIMSALEAIPNRADQAAAGMAIFGKGFKEMAGLTQESITELMDRARELGLVMSTEQAAAAHAAEVGWKSFTMQIEAAAMSIANMVLPALVALQQLASQAFQALMDGYKQTGGLFGDGTVTGSITAIGEAFIEGIAAAAGFAEGAIEGLKSVTAFAIRTGEAVINVGAALLNVMTLGTIDEKGKTILDRTQAALHSTYNALESLKGGLDAAAGVASKAFGAIEQVANGMAGRFGAAFGKARDTIAEFAEQSHNAFGGIGADVDATDAATKKFNEAWRELDSIGVDVADTLATINPKLLETINYYLRAGATVHTLAAAYPELTTAQVMAADTVEKATKKSVLETTKLWDELYALQVEHGGTAMDAQIAAVDRWFADEVAKIDYSAKNWAQHWDAIAAMANEKLKGIQVDWALLAANSKEHLQDVANKAKSTYDAALASGLTFTDGFIKGLEKTAIAAQKAADLFGTSFGTALDTVKEKTDAATGAFHQLAMASQAASIAAGAKQDPRFSTVEGRLDLLREQQANNPGTFINQTGLFGGLRAAGGDVTAGTSYMVGERGPEMFVPRQGGTIVPNGAMPTRGGGGTNLTVQTTMNGVMATDLAALKAHVDRMIVDGVKSVVKLRSA